MTIQGWRWTDAASRRRLLGAAVGGVALAGAGLAATQSLAPVAAQTGEPLVGSWLLRVTGSEDPTEHELVSFFSDGITVATNTPVVPPDPGSPPDAGLGYSTPGQGAWVKTGDRQYRSTIYFIVVGGDAVFQVTIKITLRLTVSTDGSGLSGPYTVEVRDDSDAVLFASPGDAGTVQGTRITA